MIEHELDSVRVLRRYLVLPPDRGDSLSPASVLGLGDVAPTEGQVLRALRERLGEVDRASQRLIEAGEGVRAGEVSHVRMLLHASAARLIAEGITSSGPIGLAPAQTLASTSSGSATARVAAPDRHEAPSLRHPDAFDSALLTTIAMHGGWNSAAMHHARLLAMSHAVDAAGLVRAVRGLAQRSLELSVEGAGVPVVGRETSNDVARSAAPRASATREQTLAAWEAHRADVQDGAGVGIVPRIIMGAGGLALLAFVAIVLRLTIGTPAGGTAGGPGTTSTVPPKPVPVTETAIVTAPAVADGRERAAGASPAYEAVKTPATARSSVDELLGEIHRAATMGGERALPPSEQRAGSTRASASRDLNGSLTLFAGAYEELGLRWVEASDQQIPAISHAVLEYLYRVSDSEEHARAALDIIFQPRRDGDLTLSPASVTGDALATGLLTRLSVERDLPWSLRREIERRAAERGLSVGSGDLASGIASSLRSTAARAAQESGGLAIESWEAIWGEWLRGVRAIMREGDEAYARMLIDALDGLLLAPGTPAERPAVLTGLRVLSPSLGLGAANAGGGQALARGRVISWLASPSYPSTHLSVMLAALVDAKTPGIDLSMTLSAGAVEADRQSLRERFAALWGIADASAADAGVALTRAWRDLASRALAEMSERPSREEVLTALARASHANTLAWQIATGDAEGARATLDAQSGVGGLLTGQTGMPALFTLRTHASPTGWAIAYLNAGANQAKRQEALRNAQDVGNTLEARLALGEATRGSVAATRERMRGLLLARASEPYVIGALLDVSQTTPAVQELVPMYEMIAGAKLPAARDPSFRVALRRALLTRLSTALATAQEERLADLIAAQRAVGNAYELREIVVENARRKASGQAMLVLPARDADPQPSEIARRLLPQTVTLARGAFVPSGLGSGLPAGVSLPSIERATLLLERRAELVEGPGQELVAHQIALLEVQCVLAIARAPSAVGAIAQELSECKERAAGASDVWSQALTCERSMLRVWLLSMGGGS